MKYVKMFAIPVISIVGLYVGFFQFQNCAKVNYQTQNGVTVTETGTPNGDKIAEINPEFFSDPSDLKILLIVDDSYTMSQSQQQLHQAMDSLLDPVKGRTSEIRIISTTGVLNNQVDYTSADSADVIPPGKVQRIYRPANNGRHAPFQILSTYSNDQFNEMKAKIKAEVLKVGIQGSDNEEPICASLHHLYDESGTRFFKSGDKVAVIILSDENDSSVFDQCSKMIEFMRTAETGVLYSYLQERALATVEYEVTNDNVPVQVTSQIGLALAHTHSGESNTVCSAQDRESVKSRLTAQGYNVIAITDCKYTLQETFFYGSDFGDDGSNPDRNLCTQGFTYNNQNYLNLYQYLVASQLPARAGSCLQKPLDTGSFVPTGLSTSIIPLTSVPGQNKDLLSGLQERAETLFGSGYVVASLVRRLNDSCSLQAGQSVGAIFETLTQKLGTNGVIESLCASSFSTVLTKVSNFVVSQSKKSYQLKVLEQGEYIKGINIKRGTTTFTLSSHQYEVVGSTITFLSFDPQPGDLFQVIIGKK